MLKQIEGSQGVAQAVALCRPEVICAYPISPQTHIVEGLGEMVKSGELQVCEFINVESEFAALSVAIGSSAAGARSYTATASQGQPISRVARHTRSGTSRVEASSSSPKGSRPLGTASVSAGRHHRPNAAHALAQRKRRCLSVFSRSRASIARSMPVPHLPVRCRNMR